MAPRGAPQRVRPVSPAASLDASASRVVEARGIDADDLVADVQALELLPEDGLIIDVRGNGGGVIPHRRAAAPALRVASDRA